VVFAAKAKAFMPAEPMTVSRIAGRAQRPICLRSFSPHGAASCEALSPGDALAVRPLLRLHFPLIEPACRHPALGQDLTLRARHTCDCRSILGAAKMPGAITTILHNSTTAVALSYDRLGGIKVMAQ